MHPKLWETVPINLNVPSLRYVGKKFLQIYAKFKVKFYKI